MEEDDFYPGEDEYYNRQPDYAPPRHIILEDGRILIENFNRSMLNEIIANAELQNESSHDNNDGLKEHDDSETHDTADDNLAGCSKRSSQSSLFSDAAESADSLSLKSCSSSNVSINSSNDPMRAGRYKKLRAPPPPPSDRPTAPELAASIMSDVSAAINLNVSTPPTPRRSKESEV